ncbi:MAG TPA: O-antigen ligase family protein [Blastocatellia bacterium]|nr:O-antigen ligase family protein [Blastocatellia bacterium]
MTILNKVIFSSLLVLLVLAPLPYGTVEVWSVTLWELWIFATTLLWGVLAVIEGRLSVSSNPLALPLIALLLVAVVQLLPLASAGGRRSLSYDSYATFQAAIKLSAFILFFILFTTFVNTDWRRNLVANTVIGLAFVIAIIGIGQSYIGKALWQRGTFGPFVNRNHFAGFLEMGLGMAAGLVAGRGVKRERLAIYGCVIIVLLAGLVVSASRGGMLAFVASAFLLAMIALPRREEQIERRWQKLLRAAAAVVLFFCIITGVMLLAGPEDLLNNFASISVAQGTETAGTFRQAGELYSRRDIWGATLQMIRDHPFAGVGLGAFPLAYTRYDPSSGSMRVEQAHNDYLQIVADTGITGGLIALAFIVLLFVRGFAAARTRDPRRRAVVIGALTACFAIAVHSFVDFNLQVTANAQLFLALAALATSERSHAREESSALASRAITRL